MKIHSKPWDDRTIIMSDWWEAKSDSVLEDFSNIAQNYLEQTKWKLAQVYKDILSYEEKLKNMPIPAKFNIKGTYFGWRWIYIIKDSILQDYIPCIDEALDVFYTNLEIEMRKDSDLQTHDEISENIQLRKILVKEAILEKIKSHQIDKLVHEYDWWKTKYNCNPQETISFNRWQKTYITHIFNPTLDMEIIKNVSSAWWWWENTYGMWISKDVFLPLNKINRNNDYLANIMWYNTQQELFQELKSWEANISAEWKQLIWLWSMIKRSTEMN